MVRGEQSRGRGLPSVVLVTQVRNVVSTSFGALDTALSQSSSSGMAAASLCLSRCSSSSSSEVSLSWDKRIAAFTTRELSAPG